MEEVVINELGHDGIRRLKIIGDYADMFPRFYSLVPACARDKVQMDDSKDQALGIYSMEITWPVFEPFDIAIGGPNKFRRVMVVHYQYAERVSECIRLAVEAFMAGAKMFPKYAWVREIPKGAEEFREVHGVMLISGEIAPANCVVVGGMA